MTITRTPIRRQEVLVRCLACQDDVPIDASTEPPHYCPDCGAVVYGPRPTAREVEHLLRRHDFMEVVA